MDQYDTDAYPTIENGWYEATLFATAVLPHDITRQKTVLKFMVTSGPRKGWKGDRPLWDAPPEDEFYYETQLAICADVCGVQFSSGMSMTRLAMTGFLKKIEGNFYRILIGRRPSRGKIYPSIERIEGRDAMVAHDQLVDDEPHSNHDDGSSDDSADGCRWDKCRYLVDLKIYNLGRELHRYARGKRDNRAAVGNALVELKEQLDKWVAVATVVRQGR